MKCAGCGKFLSAQGAATCSTCPLTFHKACLAISDSSTIPADWTCPECKKKLRRGDNSATPVKGNVSSPIPSPLGKKETAPLPNPPAHTAVPSEDSEIRAMRRELAAYITEQRSFRDEIRASLTNLVGRVDAIECRLEAVEKREPSVATKSLEVAELQQTVVQLKMELNDRDQESLLSDLDIGHLPEEKGENAVQIVTALAAKLGVTLNRQDIVFAERVGAPGAGAAGDSGARAHPRRLVVRLARRGLRDELLSAARVRRNLTSADIVIAGGVPRRLYVNERLTRANRQLFHRVREECRQRQWRYSWTKRGRVFARQADGKQVYSFRSDSDFGRVFGSAAV